MKYDFELEQDEEPKTTKEIHGQTACLGVARGRVKKVLHNEDMSDFQE